MTRPISELSISEYIKLIETYKKTIKDLHTQINLMKIQEGPTMTFISHYIKVVEDYRKTIKELEREIKYMENLHAIKETK